MTTLAELATLVQGHIVGDPKTPVSGAARLQAATPGEISFFEHPEKEHLLSGVRATALVVPAGYEPPGGMSAIQVDDVAGAFAQIVAHFRPVRIRTRSGVSPAAIVSPKAKLADDVHVGPHAVIEEDVEIAAGCTIHAGVQIMAGCRLGAGVTIFPNAVLYEGTIVGARSIIHAGAVLGCYGFGYKLVEGRHTRCAQLGHVEIGADVEIGALTTIDRGTYDATVVGDGTKIDNLVMIAHNCHIGRGNMICSQVGIAGSTSTGDWVVMAGQVGVRDHVHIGARSMLGAMSGVMRDVPEGSRIVGIPATPEREQMTLQISLATVTEMRKTVKSMQRTIAHLEARIEELESGPKKGVA